MKSFKIVMLGFVISAVGFVACKTKKTVTAAAVEPVVCDEKVTYQTLLPLLNKSCNTSGCHDGKGYIANFNVYGNLKHEGEDGELKRHVLVKKNMPPEQKLTEAELLKFRCWLEAGMLEK